MQVNAIIDRPLHLKPSNELDTKPTKKWIFDILIFHKTAGFTAVRPEHHAYVQQLCNADLPTKCCEKFRLNNSICQRKNLFIEIHLLNIWMTMEQV